MAIFVSVFIILAAFLSAITQKLTISGSITGGIIAFLIYAGVGYVGIALLAAFFILGNLATSWRYLMKQHMAPEKDGRKRSAGQVIANAGVAGILGSLAWQFPEYQHSFLLMLAAGFSSATADTLSSELGNLYGRRFYNILSFKRDVKGSDGVVSLEGTLFGLAGSIFISMLYILFEGWGLYFFWIILAGTIGNIADSILGASLERRQVLSNNAVNFSNTFIAALTMLIFLQIKQ